MTTMSPECAQIDSPHTWPCRGGPSGKKLPCFFSDHGYLPRFIVPREGDFTPRQVSERYTKGHRRYLPAASCLSVRLRHCPSVVQKFIMHVRLQVNLQGRAHVFLLGREHVRAQAGVTDRHPKLGLQAPRTR